MESLDNYHDRYFEPKPNQNISTDISTALSQDSTKDGRNIKKKK